MSPTGPCPGSRLFGKSGQEVTIVGLGGEGILRTYDEHERAQAVIMEAASQGISYFDSAKAYAGSEGYYGQFWEDHPDLRTNIFQTSKSASRDKDGALNDLESTLETMGLDHLDLWQIHDLRSKSDLRKVGGPGGALEAFREAKDAGKVRFIGVTGHHDPSILTCAVENWDVDSVLMPVNPLEGDLGGFLDATLQAAEEKGIAIVGMKVLGAGHYINPREKINPELLVRYALSQRITLAIVGCSSPKEVRLLAEVGRNFEPLTSREMEQLEGLFRPYARRLAFYRGVL